MKARAALSTALLFAASCALSLALAEAALRLLDAESWFDPHRRGGKKQYDETLGWRLVPNSSRYRLDDEYEVHLVVNSRGIRGPERPTEKPPGERRILVLGDSFCEGYTVEFEDLFSEVLERELNRGAGGRYEVVNMGTNGYSTDQELLAFRTEGRRYAPDLTILMFYENDVWYNDRDAYQDWAKPRFVIEGEALRLTNVPVPRAEKPRDASPGTAPPSLAKRIEAFLKRRSHLYNYSELLLDTLGYRGRRLLRRLGVISAPAAAGPAAPAPEIPDPLRIYERPRTLEVEAAWRITERLIVELRREVEAAGGEFLLFLIPESPRIYPEEWDQTVERYALPRAGWSVERIALDLADVAARNRIELIDPAGALRRRAAELGPRRRLYFLNDKHWTAAGHAEVGRLLATHLRQRWTASP